MKKLLAVLGLSLSSVIILSGCAASPPVGQIQHVYPPNASEQGGHYTLEMSFQSSYYTSLMECADNNECKDLQPGMRITFEQNAWDKRISHIRVATDTTQNR